MNKHSGEASFKVDFFTKYAVVVAFLGLGVFVMLIFIAMMLYPSSWNAENSAFSDYGSILTGNYAAGFFEAGLAIGAYSWMPIIIVYLKGIVRDFRQAKQTWGLLGFMIQFMGRVFAILVVAFPTKPWGRIHDNISIIWLGCEIISLIFIAIEMLRGKKDRLWGLIPFILIAVGVIFWLPYLLDVWKGIAIPEIASVALVFSYSIALWIRAWRGNVAIGIARTV
ncbi:MAG TPA: hypothetical protein VKM55_25755 [Candidatus Lokiarchaeia archaeon]|nr:hypothetical protein [Candidatus Lokiarchaeia archaeon]